MKFKSIGVPLHSLKYYFYVKNEGLAVDLCVGAALGGSALYE